MASVRILVVEDEVITATQIEARLRSLGYEVPAFADTAEAALHEVDQQRPDLVLMDVRLSGSTDGVAAADEIRRRYDVPVVFLTAYADHEIVRRAGAAQPYGYLLKPFVPEELSAAITLALARREAERAQTDLQRREQLEREQRTKLESLGRFAGGAAHDFNNLLTVILGAASLALLDHDAPSPTRESLLAIQEAAGRASELTSQMLAYSGKGRLVVELVDLNRLIAELCDGTRATLPPQATIELRLDGNLPVILADAAQIRRALHHLVRNALEAMAQRGDAPGCLTITTSVWHVEPPNPAESLPGGELEPGSYVAIEVADTGPGMEPATLERVFEPFFSTKFTGRGLSLAEVHGIVAGHRGTVRVDSKVGRGTAFTVLLPVPAEVRRDASRVPAHELSADAGLVLVVDDEEAVREVVGRILRRAGYRVLSAGDGASGVELFERNAAELACVLLDVTMPGIDGEQALAAMLRVRPAAPVVLMSGFSERELGGLYAGRSLAGMLQKPFAPEALLQLVRRAARRPAHS